MDVLLVSMRLKGFTIVLDTKTFKTKNSNLVAKQQISKLL